MGEALGEPMGENIKRSRASCPRARFGHKDFLLV
jgi:hypothetical protein